MQKFIDLAKERFQNFNEREFVSFMNRLQERDWELAWKAVNDLQSRVFPTPGNLKKAVEAIGIGVIQVTDGIFIEHVCLDCRARYPINLARCPNKQCQSFEQAIVRTDRIPEPEDQTLATPQELEEFRIWMKGLGPRKAQVQKVGR